MRDEIELEIFDIQKVGHRPAKGEKAGMENLFSLRCFATECNALDCKTFGGKVWLRHQEIWTVALKFLFNKNLKSSTFCSAILIIRDSELKIVFSWDFFVEKSLGRFERIELLGIRTPICAIIGPKMVLVKGSWINGSRTE
jgi:hypothetical protein